MVVALSPGELSGFGFGDAVDRPLDEELLLVTIFLFKSSLSKLFNGDTFINELKLLDVAVCNCTLPDGEEGTFSGPFLLLWSYVSSDGSCLIGINEIDGVMLVS